MELIELNEQDLKNINGGKATPEEIGEAIGYGVGLLFGSVLVAAHLVCDAML